MTVAKKKNDKKSPSLNDKIEKQAFPKKSNSDNGDSAAKSVASSKKEVAYTKKEVPSSKKNAPSAKKSTSSPKSKASKKAKTAEAEFLKEEFANEYTERELLIKDEGDKTSTLKSTDKPIDLSADVNVDLSLELKEVDTAAEIESLESIVLDGDDSFTLQIESDADALGESGEDNAADEGVIPDIELTLEAEPEEEKSDVVIDAPVATVEVNEEVVGFDFGEESASQEASDSAESDEGAIALDLSVSLKDAVESGDAQNGGEATSLSEDGQNAPAKKKRNKKNKKPESTEVKGENDTTIVDAVAKEMEDEARQTLIQKIMLTDEECKDEEEYLLSDSDVMEDKPCELENSSDTQTDGAFPEEENYEKGEDSEKSDAPEGDDTVEALSAEEEYRRALAVRDKRLKRAKGAFDFLELFIFTLLAVLVVTTFFVRHSVVEGDSMLGTLEDGQSLLVSDFMYKPECGDIIVVADYTTQLKKPIVKRIIAVGGQTVKITRHGVYVDGKLLDEPYVFTDGTVYEYNVIPSDALLENETLVTGYNYYELVVPEGELFVMGDHRNLSMDSREIGTVREDAIIGKVLVRIAPFDDFKIFD